MPWAGSELVIQSQFTFVRVLKQKDHHTMIGFISYHKKFQHDGRANYWGGTGVEKIQQADRMQS